MKYTIKEFLDKRFAVNVTEAEWPECAKMLEYAGIIWKNDKKPTQFKPAFPYVFIEEYCGENRLVHDSGSSRDFVPFRTFYADEIWRQFAAGRCYLRVTKDEWPEFAERCEAAGVKWCRGEKPSDREASALAKQGYALVFRQRGYMDGLDARRVSSGATDKPIHPFSAIARPEAEPAKPEHKVGDLYEVTEDSYFFRKGDIVRMVKFGVGTCCDVQLVSDGRVDPIHPSRVKPIPAPPAFPRIEITTDGKTTTATLYEGGKAAKTGTAEEGLSFYDTAADAFNHMRYGADFTNPTVGRMKQLGEKARALADEIKSVVGESK